MEFVEGEVSGVSLLRDRRLLGLEFRQTTVDVEKFPHLRDVSAQSFEICINHVETGIHELPNCRQLRGHSTQLRREEILDYFPDIFYGSHERQCSRAISF